MFTQYNGFNTQQIIKVHGENGARMYQLPPNSSALLLDETCPLIYLVQTDGAGYKTVNAYKIEPFVPEPEPDLEDIIQRLTRLEKKYGESHNSNDTQTKRDQQNFKKS